MNEIIIGIDPDTDKSGFAVYSEIRFSLHNFPLWEVFSELITWDYTHNVIVRLEAGWLVKNKSYHGGGKGSAYDVGRNAEIGRQIEKFCIAHKIKVELVKPFGGSSVNHESFCNFTGWDLKKPTNPETRVAGLLAKRDNKKLFTV